MRETPELERMLVNSGIHLLKFWFSVSRAEQLNRFAARETDPVRRWKLSPTDLASLDKWDDYTNAKEAMFFYTHTADAPWTVVKSNDKKRARLEAMRHVLHTLPYPNKDERLVHTPDPRICAPADVVSEVPDWEALREAGAAIKAETMARLPQLLEQLERLLGRRRLLRRRRV